MKQYRAILRDPGRPEPERPIQTVSSSISDIDDWSRSILVGGRVQGPAKIETSEKAEVHVFLMDLKIFPG